jgi:hypothetical protein
VQLQAALSRYRAQGFGVAAISYDSIEVLQTFAGRTGIGYPMLSDPDSAVIAAFGILNTQVPRNSPQYGIPHPGMYIVDPSGKIAARYFEDAYQERFTPDTVLARQIGAGGVRETEIRTEHLVLTLRQTQTRVATGNRVSLIADLEMPEKMHVYAPGATGYRPVALTIQETPNLRVHPAEFAQSEILFLPAINERVPVYHGKARITRDVTFTTVTADVEVKGTLEYQACDDKICYVPKRVPVTFSFEAQTLDRTRVPEPLQRKAP